MNRPLVPSPQQAGSDPIFIPGATNERRFPISPGALLVITILIILGIILVTIYMIQKIEQPTVVQQVQTDIIDLDALIDLKVDGQCCVQPSTITPNPRWIYSPSNNFTFTTDKLKPAVICQGLTGGNLTTCLNYVSGSDGEVKILAHRGTAVYYGFSPGQASTTICSSYGACPPL